MDGLIITRVAVFCQSSKCEKIHQNQFCQPALSYAGAGQLFRMVGDCKKVASLQQALQSAWTTARII